MLSQSETRLLHALKSRAGREKTGAFAVEGVRATEDLLAARLDLRFAIVSTSLEDSRRGAALVEALRAATAVRSVKESELSALADTDTPQGVIAVAQIPEHRIEDITPAAHSIVLVLDAIQDPGNLGTLIRSADAFASACVIALPGTVDFWNPKVVRAAAGSTFRVPLINAAADSAWSWLDTNGFVILGADPEGAPVAALGPHSRAALIIGNEGAGLRAETRAHLTTLVSIPMPGRAESLNAAVAAGILLYELSRNR